MDKIYIDPAQDSPELRALVKQFHTDAQIMGRPPRAAAAGGQFATELTPIGEQYVIPGCERVPTHSTKPEQLPLWK